MQALLLFLALTPDVAAAPPAKDPVRCERSRSSSLGTNISQPRVCKKKSEWDAQAREARRNLQKFQDTRTDPTKPRNSQPIPQ